MRQSLLGPAVLIGLLVGCSRTATPDAAAAPERGPLRLASCTGTLADSMFSTEADLDAPVRSLHFPPPVYPPAHERHGLPGQVDVRYVIDTDGRVEACHVTVLAATDASFAEAARVAVSAARFAPPRRQGHAVRVRVQQRIIFKMEHIELP